MFNYIFIVLFLNYIDNSNKKHLQYKVFVVCPFRLSRGRRSLEDAFGIICVIFSYISDSCTGWNRNKLIIEKLKMRNERKSDWMAKMNIDLRYLISSSDFLHIIADNRQPVLR